MKAILFKELKAYYLSPLGYVFTGIFILINSFFFLNGSFAYGIADLTSLFSNINIFFLFLISILTMRLLSEEKNKKTDQLLLTAPISVTEIVLGKFLAAFSVFLISLLISLVCPIVLFIFGNPSFAECIGGYVGFILVWASLISVGLFISSLTENQMNSAIFTFAALLFIYFQDALASTMPNKLFGKILSAISVFDRYNEFCSGLLNIGSIVFFLSYIFVFLFLTIKVIEKRRYS